MKRNDTSAHAPSRRAGFQWLPIALAVGGIAALGWYAIGPSGWFHAEAAPVLRGVAVQRGPLKITVVERGNLKAADSVSLKSEIEGQATILYLIPEGTHVEKGELLCELDATQLVDKRFQQEIAVRNADAAFVKARQTFEIQESQNKSDIAKAEQNLDFAREDLRKFREGDKGSRIDKAKETITLATEESTRAKEKLGWSQQLADKGFLTATELQADSLEANRADIQLQQANRDADLLERFELPRDEKELVAKLSEAERELERVQLQASARLVDFKADKETNEAKLQLEKEKLNKIETQIAKARMIAPREGMVVYGTQDSGRYGSSEPIQEGTQVRERQEVITIPSASGMIARASLHESVLKQVQVGQTCKVKVDALPGSEFEGHVAFVALLPDQQSWWANPNMRVYRTDVEIEGTHPEMRPGMSCSLEVLVEDIEDTLYVPVQAVFREGTDNIAFVSAAGATSERRVEVGRYNDKWVQILSGLQQGETVLMSAPPGMAEKIAPLPTNEATEDEQHPPTGAQPPGAPNAVPGGKTPGAPGAPGAPGGSGDGQRSRERPTGAAQSDSDLKERFQRGRDGGGEHGSRGPRGSDAGSSDGGARHDGGSRTGSASGESKPASGGESRSGSGS